MGRRALALSLFATLFCCACASQGVVAMNQEAIQKLQHEIARLQDIAQQATKAKSEVQDLEKRVVVLEGHLLVAEQRAGLKPFRSEKLQKRPPVERIELIEGMVVSDPAGKARRGSLKQLLNSHQSVVISFWATWCVPCTSREELAYLRRMRGELQSAGAAFVTMAVDGLDKVLSSPRANEWLYPLWHRKDGHILMLPRSFMESVGIGLPLFLVVGSDGGIHYFSNRKLDEETVRDLVTAAVRLRQ